MTWASSFSFEVVPMFYNLTETKQLPVIDEGFLSDSFFLRNMLASLFDLMFNSVGLVPSPLVMFSSPPDFLLRRGRNRIGRREKWPKTSWEEGEIGEIKVGRSEKWKCLQ